MLNTPSVMSSLPLPGGKILDDPPRRVDILVRKHLDRRAAQPAAVDDAGVVQFVRDDHVVFRQNRRDRARVGGEAALEHDDRLHLLELGEPALELDVELHRAGDGANRPRTNAELLDRRQRRGPQPRMRRQTEIVVRGEVDDGAVVEGGVCLLLVL